MATPTTFTPKRTQYPFGDVSTRYKSRSEILTMQDQWNTFERVENYNDIVYQKLELGLVSNMYYQFANDAEFKNYRAGQQLHIITYPNLPPGTFAPIRDRPMPAVAPKEGFPYTTGVERFIVNTDVPTASETRAALADLEIYTYVSTFNATHALKYAFVDDVEKNAYERVELRLNAIP